MRAHRHRLTPLDHRDKILKGNVSAGIVVAAVVLAVTADVVTVILI